MGLEAGVKKLAEVAVRGLAVEVEAGVKTAVTSADMKGKDIWTSSVPVEARTTEALVVQEIARLVVRVVVGVVVGVVVEVVLRVVVRVVTRVISMVLWSTESKKARVVARVVERVASVVPRSVDTKEEIGAVVTAFHALSRWSAQRASVAKW